MVVWDFWTINRMDSFFFKIFRLEQKTWKTHVGPWWQGLKESIVRLKTSKKSIRYALEVASKFDIVYSFWNDKSYSIFIVFSHLHCFFFVCVCLCLWMLVCVHIDISPLKEIPKIQDFLTLRKPGNTLSLVPAIETLPKFTQPQWFHFQGMIFQRM